MQDSCDVLIVGGGLAGVRRSEISRDPSADQKLPIKQ
jgi:hypothetical protein